VEGAITRRMKAHPTWLVANWKMHGSRPEVEAYARGVEAALAAAPANVAAIFCPPAPYIVVAAAALPASPRLALGGQNCHAQPKGAFTGEVSAAMLADLGARYVILGHSERRATGETCPTVAAKAQAALDAGLTPILCIGESQEDYDAGQTLAVLAAQLAALKHLAHDRVLIAYEPIWAIGSGRTPSTAEISAAHVHIKSVLGSQTSVLYGGSVNAANAREILDLPGVAGALVGSASLTVSGMQALIDAASA